LSSIDSRRGHVELGSSRVAVAYPEALELWFGGILKSRDREAGADKWADIVWRPHDGRFDVAASIGGGVVAVELGEALAVFWERVCTLLIDDLADSMVLHAAALQRDGRVVLVAGQSGCGKTRLALWLRTRGFALATDEVVTVTCMDGALSLAALPRPVVVKNETDPAVVLRAGEKASAQNCSPHGLMLRVDAVDVPPLHGGQGLIVFPRFRQGAALSMAALTPGETALRLIENSLNVRNLPRGGLPLASLLARRFDAVNLDYGDATQLDGALDVLARLPLAGRMDSGILASLCAAFSGRIAVTPTARLEAPAATAVRFARRLTVGMATYDDYDGAYFTLQALRMGHRDLDGDLEFVIVDNHPGGPCSGALARLATSVDGCRYVPRGEWSGTAIRNAVFEEASSPFVMCVDSHVLVAPGALSKLLAWFESDPDSRDLVQGPMVHDDMRTLATHMDPRWRSGMFGVWAEDERARDADAPAFEIPMQGMGLFACSRSAWPGFHSGFRGFGGEEGYIHEKFRRRGGRTLCLPFLRWMHRFGRPHGTAYVNRWEDRMRNYLIGFSELGLDVAAMEAHFAELLGTANAARIFAAIKSDLDEA
jgi:hypothetical protein